MNGVFFCKFHLYISLISIGIGNGSKFLQKLMMLILSRLMLVYKLLYAAFKIWKPTCTKSWMLFSFKRALKLQMIKKETGYLPLSGMKSLAIINWLKRDIFVRSVSNIRSGARHCFVSMVFAQLSLISLFQSE